jgi:uroporphyrinogen-III synthase
VTRPKDQTAELVRLLEDRGATAVLAPAIELLPADPEELARAIVGLAEGRFEWLVVTSRAGVAALVAAGLEAVRAKVAAVGDGTAGALRDAGIEVDLVPPEFTTESLAEAMPSGTGEVLLARADIAPGALEEALAAKGWTTARVDAYRTQLAWALPFEANRALETGKIDAVTFTSASTVRGFVGAAGRFEGPKIVCIGPVTAEECRKAGIEVDAVADPHTIDGLVAALERVLAPAAAAGSNEEEGVP